jgi:anti-sigma B factor antagonist
VFQPNEEGRLSDSQVKGDGLREDPVLRVETIGTARIVRLGGELDLYNADRVRDALADACADSPERVVVDLSEVQFMDSTALGVLIEARTKLRNQRGFFLASPGLETRRALQISGLDRHFSVHDTVPEALMAKV